MTKGICNKTSFVSNVLYMVAILVFPFLGMEEISDNKSAATV